MKPDTELVATLSMYDWPETSAALDRFWELIRNELRDIGVDAPDGLYHVEEQMPLWTSPGLVVGQTCGWPYISELRGKVVPFARFDHGLEGCPAGYYRSVFIGNDPVSARYLESAEALVSCSSIAINSTDSQSGYRVFGELPGAKEKPPALQPEQLLITGAHRESVRAVADAKAEIAAIDGVAFELAKRHESEATEKVCILGYSIPRPGLPLITAPGNATKAEAMFQAAAKALEKLTHKDRETLVLCNVLKANDVEYEVFEAV